MELFYNQHQTCWGLREYVLTPSTRRTFMIGYPGLDASNLLQIFLLDPIFPSNFFKLLLNNTKINGHTLHNHIR